MNALDKIVAEINKQYKQPIIQKGTSRVYVERIKFSSPRANYMTYGGIPKGKATELFGPEGGGKTTAALDLVGQAQKQAVAEWSKQIAEIEAELTPLVEKNNKSDKDKIKKLQERYDLLQSQGPKRAAYVDAENTLDEDWAKMNGVNTDELLLIRPEDQSAEQVLQIMLDLIDTGLLEIIVLDSVPMLVSQQLFDKTLETKSYAGIAGALTEFSRKVSPKISRNHTALLIINQVRDDIENPYNLYNTPGGRALKHLFALRMYCRKGSFLDEKNQEVAASKAVNPHGNKAELKIIKTKVCKPDRLVGFHTINYSKGVDVLNDTIEMAIEYGMISQSGAWYYILDPDTGEVMTLGDDSTLRFQGRAALLTYLEEDVDLFEELYEAVMFKILGKEVQAEDFEEYETSEPKLDKK